MAYVKETRPYTNTERICYTIKEVCDMLGMSRQHVNVLMASGELPRVKLGIAQNSPVRIMKDDLYAYIDRYKEAK